MAKNKDVSKSDPNPHQLEDLLKKLVESALAAKTPYVVHSEPPVKVKDFGATKGPCTIEGCKTPSYAKGLCSKHYHRALRHKHVTGEDMHDRVNNAVSVTTTIPVETYRLLEAAAARNKLSMFRALRWLVVDWAEIEKRRPTTMSGDVNRGET